MIINIGTATIASTVGASTLGTPIIIGLSGFNTAYVIQGVTGGTGGDHQTACLKGWCRRLASTQNKGITCEHDATNSA